ncbi:unnamed protein product, partial [Brenthis ino]
MQRKSFELLWTHMSHTGHEGERDEVTRNRRQWNRKTSCTAPSNLGNWHRDDDDNVSLVKNKYLLTYIVHLLSTVEGSPFESCAGSFMAMEIIVGFGQASTPLGLVTEQAVTQ